MKSKLNEVTKKPWFKWTVNIIIIPLVMGLGFYLGTFYQNQADQQQLNTRLNHIDCSVAQILSSYYTSKGESVTIISNPDGSCSLQFNVGFSETIHFSECVNIVISRANGSMITENGCSTTSTTIMTSTSTSSTQSPTLPNP
jgi:hypothetical protein